MCVDCVFFFFFFKQKTAYEMRISDWSSDVCSSDLLGDRGLGRGIDPVENARIGDAPERAIERQRRQIGFEDLRRIETRQAGGRGFLPQPIGDSRDRKSVV